MPKHVWGEHDPVGIPTSEMAARYPLGDGPFQIVNWEPGQYILLEPNPHYYLADQGYPYLDSLTFRFVSDTDQLAAFLLIPAILILLVEIIFRKTVLRQIP